jgi:hypothetical protein
MEDDLTQLRRRHDDLEADLDRLLTTATAGTAALVAKVISGTTAGAMFGVQLQETTCAETEGAAPTFTAVGPTIFALHLGGTAPAIGQPVLMTQIDGTWIFIA